MTNWAFSPSQLQAAECHRKWYLRYQVKGIKIPRSTAAEFGERCHRVAELWHVNRTAPDLQTKEGRAFAAGLKLNPKAVEAVELKGEIEVAGIRYVMKMDLVADGQVWDHKFVESIEYSAKTASELKNDPQGIVYGVACAEMSEEHGEHPTVTLLYYQTDAKAQKVVSHTYSHDQLSNLWQVQIDPLARKLLKLRRNKPKVFDVVPNTSVCQQYGGCAFRKYCTDVCKVEE